MSGNIRYVGPGLFILTLVAVVCYFMIDLPSTQLMASRIALFLFIAGLIVTFLKPTAVKQYFSEEGSPQFLGVFRLIVFAILGISAFIFPTSHPVNFNLSPVPVAYAGWFEWLLPNSIGFFQAVSYATAFFALLAVVGLFTRYTALITALLALYVFGVPEFYGKVTHYHHLIWFSWVLAFSPCGDAVSVDSLRNKKSNSEYAVKYATPIKIIWLLLGITYFFPGFWKVYSVGLDWIFSDNLQYQIFLKWQKMGVHWSPILPTYASPWLYVPGALLAILLEVSFIFLVFSKRIRPLLFATGILFHIGIALSMGIGFYDLMVYYLAFLVLGYYYPFKQVEKKSLVITYSKPLVGLGVVLIVGNIFFGLMKVNSWPLTCYPTFDFIPRKHYELLQFTTAATDSLPARALDEEELLESYGAHNYRNWCQIVIDQWSMGDTTAAKAKAGEVLSIYQADSYKGYNKVAVWMMIYDIDPFSDNKDSTLLFELDIPTNTSGQLPPQ